MFDVTSKVHFPNKLAEIPAGLPTKYIAFVEVVFDAPTSFDRGPYLGTTARSVLKPIFFYSDDEVKDWAIQATEAGFNFKVFSASELGITMKKVVELAA